MILDSDTSLLFPPVLLTHRFAQLRIHIAPLAHAAHVDEGVAQQGFVLAVGQAGGGNGSHPHPCPLPGGEVVRSLAVTPSTSGRGPG